MNEPKPRRRMVLLEGLIAGLIVAALFAGFAWFYSIGMSEFDRGR